MLPLLGALFLAGMCASRDSVPAAPVTFRTIHQGAYATVGADMPGLVLVTDQETYRTVWKTNVGEGTPPPVDFSRESVVFLFGGQRPTGGFSVEPLSTAVAGDEVTIDVEVHAPAPHSMVTQAITSPFAVIAVPSPILNSARWRDREGRVVTDHTRRTR
ncbi:MAG TPA: protease complex subunit PrcB family protein [Thermoanaerobaculia bacterium]|nr:protease complex subunit PrcB family protein [Thermoanaerobaculia bacterium]